MNKQAIQKYLQEQNIEHHRQNEGIFRLFWARKTY